MARRKYHLALQDKYGYKDILWSKLKPSTDIYSLASIVDFTTQFSTTDALKIYLFNNELINSDDVKKNITIYYRDNNKDVKLKYGNNGISLSSDKKFLTDINILKNVIISHSSDLEFLQKICNHYRKTYYQGPISNLQLYINDYNRGSYNESLLRSAVESLVFTQTRDVSNINKETGEVSISYKKYRDFAMFISYLVKNEKSKSNNQSNLNRNSQLLLNEFEDKKSNDGLGLRESEDSKYTDFERDLWEQNFPPNSEELRRYMDYIESLPDENINKNEHKI